MRQKSVQIEVGRHYYSVPRTLSKKKVDVRITQNTVERFYKSKRMPNWFCFWMT